MEAVGTPASLPAGTRFGSFGVVRPLAAGGMAELYLAARPGPGGGAELVAVKRLLPHLGWDPEFVRMFLDEVRIAASLDHPNIVRVVDFGVGEGGHYLAMEYLHGRDLRAVQRSVGTAGALSLAFAVGTIVEIAAGLHAAHEHRDPQGRPVEVVHRDVSPSNVIVTGEGRVVLVDFGIARVAEHTQLTRAGTLKGKMGYMSPEQCRGNRVDRRSDVFGLGIMLYELTVGRRAFFADNDYAVIGKICDGDYPRPRAVVPEYPSELEAIVVRALEVEADDRYPTAAAMIEDLRRLGLASGLDLGPGPRVAEMHARFGTEPLPYVDLAALRPQRQPSARSGSALRWGALMGVGVAIGAVGFLAGGVVRDEPALGESAEGEGPAAPASARGESGSRGGEPVVSPEPGDSESPAEVLTDGPPEPEGSPELVLIEVATSGEEGSSRSGASRGRSRKPRRKKVEPAHPKGDPNSLLPPSWRDDNK